MTMQDIARRMNVRAAEHIDEQVARIMAENPGVQITIVYPPLHVPLFEMSRDEHGFHIVFRHDLITFRIITPDGVVDA